MRNKMLCRILAVALALTLLGTALPLPARGLDWREPDAEQVRILLEEYLTRDRLSRLAEKLYQRLSEKVLARLPADLLQRLEEAFGTRLPGESLPAEIPEGPALLTAEETVVYTLYRGLLHAHSSLSDGTAAPEEVFRHAANMEQMDFFALTDHSDYFDNAMESTVDADALTFSADWAAGKTAAAAATAPDFLGIFGYEMSWPQRMQIGHIGTFATPGFASWLQETYQVYDGALERYYAAMAAVPGALGQFNHPGTRYGDFAAFDHCTPDADRVMNLLEVFSSEPEGYERYIRALDRGWHVAPTAAQEIFDAGWEDSGWRTAVYAGSLTEEAVFDAVRSHRVYASQDRDLDIMYTVNGHGMGSELDLTDIGERISVAVTLSDPTDRGETAVEVITTAGQVLETGSISAGSGSLEIVLPPAAGYYFLRITQSDGDQAVTAPVWVEETMDIGISGLRCETPVPVQRSPVTLSMTLRNGENADFAVDTLDILADGIPVYRDRSLTEIPAMSSREYSLAVAFDCVGLTRVTVRLAGTIKGRNRICEADLDLSFHQASQVTGIAVDGSHGNVGLDRLTELEKTATEKNIRMTVLQTEAAMEDLKDCRFLLIPAPTRPFSEEFLETLGEFASWGGSLVVCGQADLQDAGLHSARELNRVLSRIGSAMTLADDVVLDTVNNGGSPELIYTDDIDRAASWCAGVTENQVWRHAPGCSIYPGDAAVLVQSLSTAVSADGDGDSLGGGSGRALLGWEELPGGGSVFVSGCLFCEDDSMEAPRNIWDEPYANRTIMENLLAMGGEAVELSTIRQARYGAENQLFRVRGYVTAGTSNPYNTFPETLYLQDDTGGIPVIPFEETGIQLGTPMEIIGYALELNGNRCLKVQSWKILDAAYYNYLPLTGPWETLLDPLLHGGTLVEAEGLCLEIYCREDGTLAGCLLKDDSGNLARVKIEDGIGNGSDGGNDLHRTIRRGRTVRAMGILHVDEFGDTVLRVRNCEEVVWVPPRHILIPATGDGLYLPVVPLVLSLAGLLLLRKRPRRGKYQR